jgi:hypothetical protein
LAESGKNFPKACRRKGKAFFWQKQEKVPLRQAHRKGKAFFWQKQEKIWG